MARNARLFGAALLALAVMAAVLVPSHTRATTSGIITTIAGGGGDGGPATAAAVDAPETVALDSAGNVYIAATEGCSVRMISGGVISTVAGDGTCGYNPSVIADGSVATSVALSRVWGIAVDGNGTLFIADFEDCHVWQVKDGLIFNFAGTSTCGYAGDGGPATSAQLNDPYGIAVDASGNVYVADVGNCRVREVTAGVITTAAGSGCSVSPLGDGGPATSAKLESPTGVAVDVAGNLFIAEQAGCRIREVSGGAIATVAGNGSCGYAGDGGAATSAEIAPSGVALDTAGNLYITDDFAPTDCRVREVSSGTITTVVGNGTCGYGGDGGPAISASLSYMYGSPAADQSGNLYIADAGNCRVREVSGGMITTVAGTGACTFSGDGGQATSATLSGPAGIAVSANGDLFIADSLNCRIRQVSAGIITTAAGNGVCQSSGDGGTATSASIFQPTGVAVDGSGNIFVADTRGCRIREISGGMITTVAGDAGAGTCLYSGDGGPALTAGITTPYTIALDGNGNLFIVDYYNCVVREVRGGMINVVAGSGTCGHSGDGGPATSAELNHPYGLAVDGSGSLYITDATDCRVREVTGGIISTIAGTGICGYSGDGGPATSAMLQSPQGIAVDGSGNLFIADWANCRVRAVSAGVITTVAGMGSCGYSGDAGPATSAKLYGPTGVAVDANGNLYVSTDVDGRVRVVDPVASVASPTPTADPTYCAVQRADVNGDGVVNILDLGAVASHYDESVPPAPQRYDQGQTPDGVINILDLSQMAAVYGDRVSACP